MPQPSSEESEKSSMHAESIAAAVSPVPGGVGRVTTAVLALHTVEAAERANI